MRRFIAALLLCIQPLAANSLSFIVEEINDLPGGSNVSIGHGLNNLGQVVGSSNTGQGNYRAFVWQNGVSTDLGGPYFSHVAYDINDTGTITGVLYPNPGTAFRWQNGVFEELNRLPGGSGGQEDVAYGINADGTVVGRSRTGSATGHAVKWPGDTAMSVCAQGTASAINDNGDIVGWGCGQNGFVVEGDGTFRSTSINGVDINNSGVVVGQNTTNGLPAMWFEGISVDLTTSGGGVANAVNEEGEIVGEWEDDAFLWDSDLGMMLLRDHVNIGSEIFLGDAVDINESGQILVNGYIQIDGSNYQRAFLLTPVPIPAAAYLFVSALGVLGWMRRRVS